MDDTRFWGRTTVNPETGCIEWQGYRQPTGYGWLNRGNRYWLAHRYAWFLRHGSLPKKGMHLDHLCRNPPCVNVDHLEAVTNAENIRRGDFTVRRSRTHCPKGHEFTPENTIQRPKQRACRECYLIRKRAWRRRKVADPAYVERERRWNRESRARRAEDPEWREKERARLRELYHRKRKGA